MLSQSMKVVDKVVDSALLPDFTWPDYKLVVNCIPSLLILYLWRL